MATVCEQVGVRLELGEKIRKKAAKRDNIPVQFLLDFSGHFEVPNALRTDFDQFDNDKLAAHEAALVTDIGKSALRGRIVIPESFSNKHGIPLV